MQKPIIIDGVDVSGCEYWKNYCRISALPDFIGHLCELNPNYYYKRLQKEKRKYSDLTGDIELLSEKLEKVCVENSSLKSQIEKLYEEIDRYETGFCPKCIEWAEKHEKLSKENEALRRANQDWGHTTAELRGELAELKEKHNNVLNLAKMSADTSEYCLHELEEQQEDLKKQNESLRNHISDLLNQLAELKEAQNA